MATSDNPKHVVIVGGGFAGLACAKKLSKYSGVKVTLIDKQNFHQFTPLLYQVATGELSSEDIATPFRNTFSTSSNVDFKMEVVLSIDPQTRTVKTASGNSYSGDFLVLAAGSVVNFFGIQGAPENSFPLYSLREAELLRSRIIEVFENAERTPSLVEKGALNFVVVGAGPTGTEMAGSLADMINLVLPKEYKDLNLKAARIYIVDYGHTVLSHFSEESQEYAVKVLSERGVVLKLGVGVKEVMNDYVLLTDGTKILSHTVVWAGGLKAAELVCHTGLSRGSGGRLTVQPDLTVSGSPGIYALGDFANNLAESCQEFLPQLASVAQQSGNWAASNIVNQIEGKPTLPFEYNDKGIMAMIGRNAAVADIGKKRHVLEGVVAFAAWLGVHAALMSSIRQKINAFIDWAWEYFSKKNEYQILDRNISARIDWNE